MPSAGNAEWVQSYKFQPLYRIFWISTLMSEMTFHRARSPERKNFLHLRLLTAARVDLQEFFHMLMWKTEPSLTPRSRSVICGLEGGRGKNTCICISIKKQVRMIQVISYNRSSSQQENWNSELPGLHRSALAASSKPWNATAWMENHPHSFEELKFQGRVPLVASGRGILDGLQRETRLD